MAEIHIYRTHALGLARARQVALRWAEDAEKKFDMECTIVEGEDSDVVEFTRTGVKGTLQVEADRFTLDATLGFLLGAFRGTIESEIEKNLDALLGEGAADTGGPARKTAAKPAARPAAKAAKKTAR